jgi:hypothetical protein
MVGGNGREASFAQNRMKPRHATALALVSWYLIMPPPLASNPNKPDLSAPLFKVDRAHESGNGIKMPEVQRCGNLA